MKRKLALLTLLVLGINIYSQEIRNTSGIELRYGFLIHDYTLNTDISDTGVFFKYDENVHSLIGFKNEIIMPLKKEYINILIGYIFQYGRSNRTIFHTAAIDQEQQSYRRVNNGGIYAGLNYNGGDKIGINSSLAIGLYYYRNILVMDSDDFWELSHNEYIDIKSLSIGTLISIGPYINVGQTKINLSFESLINGNKKFMHFSYGANLGMSLLF
jgi:hypothetical protein